MMSLVACHLRALSVGLAVLQCHALLLRLQTSQQQPEKVFVELAVEVPAKHVAAASDGYGMSWLHFFVASQVLRALLVFCAMAILTYHCIVSYCQSGQRFTGSLGDSSSPSLGEADPDAKSGGGEGADSQGDASVQGSSVAADPTAGAHAAAAEQPLALTVEPPAVDPPVVEPPSASTSGAVSAAAATEIEEAEAHVPAVEQPAVEPQEPTVEPPAVDTPSVEPPPAASSTADPAAPPTEAEEAESRKRGGRRGRGKFNYQK
eukprot:TRINITY_DN16129_c0_g1_i1.p1 TRINITY_DN16129_c0_g1~~TRINITY_DN16129_c0_g1_i1.p1  ORF type:complete len:262 (+),score=50.14 TRINITY_DN16129_c0_g1_i1:54-839(+)